MPKTIPNVDERPSEGEALPQVIDVLRELKIANVAAMAVAIGVVRRIAFDERDGKLVSREDVAALHDALRTLQLDPSDYAWIREAAVREREEVNSLAAAKGYLESAREEALQIAREIVPLRAKLQAMEERQSVLMLANVNTSNVGADLTAHRERYIELFAPPEEYAQKRADTLQRRAERDKQRHAFDNAAELQSDPTAGDGGLTVHEKAEIFSRSVNDRRENELRKGQGVAPHRRPERDELEEGVAEARRRVNGGRR